MEEVKKDIFQLNPNKAPGLTGFPTAFFQTYWDNVGQGLVLAVEESRRKIMMLGALNHTFLSFILKKCCPREMGDFKPIALCNTVYKIVTKVIANRLKLVLNNLISNEHSAFAPRSSIVEGIIIAHETLHSTRKSKDSCIILKLDILKTYDIIER